MCWSPPSERTDIFILSYRACCLGVELSWSVQAQIALRPFDFAVLSRILVGRDAQTTNAGSSHFFL